MKGRHTSFQRFGSGSHNPFGSVLNKYFLTESEVRKNNIYEKTLDFYPWEEDLGEEVYGCLAKGINTQGHLEFSYEDMEAKRKTRGAVEQYVLGSEGTILRKWEDESKKTYEDSALVPQESIPLNVISKYPIKLSADTYDDNDERIVRKYDIPPSAGFSGPFLYRPKKYPSDFTPSIVKEDCVIGYRPVSSVSIPADVAHKIINCTKEIKFTGDLDHSIDAENKKCSGNISRNVTQTYYQQPLCPGGSPMQRTRTAAYSCTSSSEKTTLRVKGSVGGTMSRYNLMTSIWDEEPVKLDLSANIYHGSNAQKANNFFVRTGLDCECDEDYLCPDPFDYLKAKMLGEREKVTKLEAGCAVTTPLDLDIIRHDQGDNLLLKKLGNKYCEGEEGGFITKELLLAPLQNDYYGGIYLQEMTPLGPKINITSGPTLLAKYSAGLAEYVGVESDELIFEPKKCPESQFESFRSPKGDPIKTGLNATMTGVCPNGLGSNDYYVGGGIQLYDATNRGYARDQWCTKNTCQPCGVYSCDLCGCCPPCSAYGEQGAYKLACSAEKQCYKDEDNCGDRTDPAQCPAIMHPSGSDLSKATSDCSVPFAHSLMIGRYVQTFDSYTNNGLKYINASPIPLDANAKNTDAQDLCISFLFVADGQDGLLPQAPLRWGYMGALDLNPISTCKKWHENQADLTGYGYIKSVDQVGALTLKSGDWSTAIPLWITNYRRMATSCEGTDVQGVGGHHNWIMACERTTRAYCDDDCECCLTNIEPYFPYGCGTLIANEEPCDLPVPCEPLICTYSYSSSFTGTEDCPQKANCNPCFVDENGQNFCGGCKGNCDNCACCGCNCGNCDRDGKYDNPCPPRQATPPTTYSGTGKLGCYGSAQEEQIVKTTFNVTLEFLPFTELGGVKQT